MAESIDTAPDLDLAIRFFRESDIYDQVDVVAGLGASAIGQFWPVPDCLTPVKVTPS